VQALCLYYRRGGGFNPGLFSLGKFFEFSCEPLQCQRTILRLRSEFSGRCNNAGGDVGDAHRSLNLVFTLASGTAAAIKGDFQVTSGEHFPSVAGTKDPVSSNSATLSEPPPVNRVIICPMV